MAFEKTIQIIVSAKDSTQDAMKSIQKSTKDISEKFQGVGIASTAALVGIVGFSKQAIDANSELQNSMIGLNSIVKGLGLDVDRSKQIIQEFTKDGLVSSAEAATSLKNLLSRGFSLDEATVLMNRFKDSAAFGRQSMLGLGEAIQGATEGLKNENSMLVDNAGVTKNVAKMWEEYAKAKGIKNTEMTIEMKREAELQGIMKETQFQVGDAIKVTETYAGQQAKLSAQTLQLQQTIGGVLMPTLAGLLQSVTPIVETLATWIQNNPELTKTIIIVTTAATALGASILIISPIISAIVTAFGALTVASGVLGTAFTFLMATPIGLLISALAILAGALLAVYMNWETIGPKLKVFWENLSADMSAIITDFISFSKTQLTAFMTWFSSKVEWIGGMALKAKEYVASALSAAGNIATGGLGTMAADALISGARANGGPVSGGKTYLVGERGPELFTPGSSGNITSNEKLGGGSTININLGGVSVSGEADENRLVEKIKRALIRETQLFNNGIS